jgi:hypothetical protein
MHVCVGGWGGVRKFGGCEWLRWSKVVGMPCVFVEEGRGVESAVYAALKCGVQCTK